ncbi:MAG: type II toxin-antitoxin system RelE/ParE family toxin [Planctomycetaceae bacterium]|nr:type II toxin-antitoxin system RelE/ParE family toxin [Planctomycetaceae bacterium]
MSYDIIWSQRATQELQEIAAYSADDNANAASRFVANVIHRVQRLALLPGLGGMFPDPCGRILRQIIVGKYRVVYQIDEQRRQVIVMPIWHSARRDPGLRE